jgi:hypothetical protein
VVGTVTQSTSVEDEFVIKTRISPANIVVDAAKHGSMPPVAQALHHQLVGGDRRDGVIGRVWSR